MGGRERGGSVYIQDLVSSLPPVATRLLTAQNLSMRSPCPSVDSFQHGVQFMKFRIGSLPYTVVSSPLLSKYTNHHHTYARTQKAKGHKKNTHLLL